MANIADNLSAVELPVGRTCQRGCVKYLSDFSHPTLLTRGKWLPIDARVAGDLYESGPGEQGLVKP